MLHLLVLLGLAQIQLTDSSTFTPPDSTPVASLGKTIVTATRRETQLCNAPGISFVIDRQDLTAVKASRASEALEYVPGLGIEAGTGVGVPFKKNIAINGLPSFHNIVLVDGRRLLSSHAHTGANIDMVPAASIERIEILKDASSAAYGSDALGGVINIITRKGTDRPALDFEVGGGSQATLRSGLLLRGSTAGTVYHSSYAGWEQSKGLPIVEGMRKDQLDYKQLTLMEQVDVEVGTAGRIGASVHFANQMDLPYRGAFYDSWLFTPGMNFEWTASKDLTISAMGYYSQWNADLSVEKSEIASPQIWLCYTGLPNQALTVGAEYDWRNFRRDGVAERDQRLAGAFVQDELALFERLVLLGALRLDYVDNSAAVADVGPRLSPKLSLLYRPIASLAIRAGGGSGFRAPYVQDLYESRYHPSGGGIWRYGNQRLAPELSGNVNGGLTWTPTRSLTLLVNGYGSRLSDMIALVRGSRDSSGVAVPRDTVFNGKRVPIWERANINRYQIGGVETAVSVRQGNVTAEIGASATWQQSDDTKAADALMYPGQKAYGRINWELPVWSGWVSNGFIGAQRVFNRRAPNGAGRLDDYTNLEAGLGVVYNARYEWYLRGRNLLAQEMQTFEDALWTIRGEPLFEAGLKAGVF